MKSFEEYLKEHKEKLGTIEVDPVIWTNVENELLRKKHHRIRLYLRIAVGFILLMALSAIINYNYFNTKSYSQFSLTVYSPELGKMEQDFKKAIQYQTCQVQSLEISNKFVSDFNVFFKELKELDKHYERYIDLIEQSGYSEDIGNKILEYYSLKLELLKKIQFEIIKINSFKKNNTYENDKTHIQL